MLEFPYHARYELIEFAVLTLTSRSQSLVPLHAACIGKGDHGLLLMGNSGSGKSTLGLHALAEGLQLLSEDSAFVEPKDLRATGVPNYIYLGRDSLRFVDKPIKERIEQAPMIRRRSGAQKYEIDLRAWPGNVAKRPLTLVGTIILSRRSASAKKALKQISPEAFVARLRTEQAYATRLTNWQPFETRIAKLPSFELRRLEHPDEAVNRLRRLLE